VPGARVETAEDLTQQLARALSDAGPSVIEAIVRSRYLRDYIMLTL
jgi:thiamine pyrophosphate-dependent acetolactate synthase large subunit-like protein